MSWPDRLLKSCTFRGVRFEAVLHSLQGGRRVQVTEFPGEDLPATDDHGGRAHSYSLSGFVAGPDYDRDRDRLVKALQVRGPGVLEHPWLGKLSVQIQEWTIGESVDELGVASVEIACVESGEGGVKVSEDTEARVTEAAESLRETQASAFASAWSVTSQPDLVQARALEDVLGHVESVLDAVTSQPSALVSSASAVVVALASIENAVADLIHAPEDLAAAWLGVFGQIENLAIVELLTDNGPASGPAAASTPTETTAAKNTAALDRLIHRVALSRGAELASAATYQARQDAAAARRKWVQRLREEGNAGAVGEEFRALVALRVALYVDLGEREVDLPELRTLDRVQESSSLELAWQLYGDATRADEIANRNRSANVHPLFLRGALEVLSI